MMSTTVAQEMRSPERGSRQGKRIRKCVCHVRFTMYDVRFINNVRVAQIFFESLMCAEIPLEPS